MISEHCSSVNLSSITQTHFFVDHGLSKKCGNIKSKLSSKDNFNHTNYSAPIRFRLKDPEDAKHGPKKRAIKPYKKHVIVLKKSTKLSTTFVSLLSNWEQLLKTWGSTSYKRVELMCFITFLGISLDNAGPRDCMFVANLLQNSPKTLRNNSQLLPSKNAFAMNSNLFTLLEQATEAYFNYANPFNPFFTRANFFRRPRSKFLRLCIWRVGLQYLPSSELLTELCDSIKRQILLRIVPSALTFELSTLQGLAILYLGLYDSSLNKFRFSMLYYASILVNCLGLHIVPRGPLNQERLLTLFTFGYNKIMATSASKSAWCNLLPDFPLQTSAWPDKTYSNVGELYKDHPNNRRAEYFSTEPFSATIDANMATFCLSAYQLHRIVCSKKSNNGFETQLRQVLVWGTQELQRSKVLQLPNQQLVPLAFYPLPDYDNILSNYPESNLVLTQLQLVLHSHYHQASLSTSNPYHTFRLVELLELISIRSPLFKRLTMLLDATRYLLMLSRDSKVERYLNIVRSCFKNMEAIEYSQHYAGRYLVLFDALLSRANIAKSS